jgi:hypothetical protein
MSWASLDSVTYELHRRPICLPFEPVACLPAKGEEVHCIMRARFFSSLISCRSS